MGFDNECVLNITSLPGEYFCPVCRTLVCPKEALQAQCTHLYCKSCLSYVVATTQACPYDGYLVTEADSKPLMESNKFLAETVGKVAVHCLYHKSGCQYQGQLSDCITHVTTCAYGNSPVVCNRCGTQIVHRQVQEHAHLCPGQPRTQQAAGSSLTQSTAATTQAVTQYPYAANSTAPSVAAAPAPTTAVPSAVATSSAGASATTTSMVAVPPSSVAAPIATSQGQADGPQTPTAEQYQQQLHYQQHYPGHNPYMQQYQQYGQYQQYTQSQMQVASQNAAQAPAQSASYVQPQVLQPSQPLHMVPSHSQNKPGLPQLQAPAVQPHPRHNPPLQSAPQIPQMQPQSQVPLQVPLPQAHSTAHPPASTQVGSQPFAIPATQATPSQVQPHAQPHPPEYQQVHSQQHLQLQHLPQQQHLQSHIQLNSQIQHPHPQVQQESYPQPQTYYQPHPMAHAQPHPPTHAVASHQSYPQPQSAHDTLQGAPLQHPVHASQQQVIGSQQLAPVRPSQSQVPLQGQQSTMPPQGTLPKPQQQHVGNHAQMPPMHPSIPSQAPQPGVPLNTQSREDSSDKGKINDKLAGWESNSHGPDVQGHKESKPSDTSNDLEKRGSLQQASQQNLGPPGSSSMGPQHPAGPDRILPHNMLHPRSMPYVQGQSNQMRPPMNKFPENIRPPMQQQPYGSYHSEMAPRAPVPNQNQNSVSQPITIRANDGMIRPPMGGPFPGQHDTTVPPFASEYLGTGKSNSVGVGPHASSRTFREAGLSSSQEHFRSSAAYPGRHNSNLRDIEENIKEFPGPTHLEREGGQWGPRPFEGSLGRPEGFANPLPGRPPFSNQPGSYPIGLFEEFSRKPHSPDFVSTSAEFGYHRIDGMSTLRNAGGHGGPREDQPYSGNLPGNVQHDFRCPEFPHPRFHPGDGFVPRSLHGGGPLGHVQLRGMEPSGYHNQGHMQQDDHFAIDYSHRGFQKESGHFGSDGHFRNGDDGWCRICKFNCGTIENLELHVYTREHRQCAMDIVLKMKHDAAKNHNINPGGHRSFSRKVVGKGNVRGNRR